MTPQQNTAVLEERKAHYSPVGPYYAHYAESTANALLAKVIGLNYQELKAWSFWF